MLASVDAGLPVINGERTNASANIPVTMAINQQMPAMRAQRAGDAISP
jgi:hypothetical protein